LEISNLIPLKNICGYYAQDTCAKACSEQSRVNTISADAFKSLSNPTLPNNGFAGRSRELDKRGGGNNDISSWSQLGEISIE
jgi:hypothetical protein